MAECRSCGARIIWTRTEHGRRMPVDEAPAPAEVHAGFVLRVGCPTCDGGQLQPSGIKCPTCKGDTSPLAISATREQLPGELLHLSHFATCPNANEWRRRG
jgi:hypothetical protein